MSGFTHRNISFATVAGLKDVLDIGSVVDVRGQRIREIRNRVTTLERPRERCLFVPNRGNDVVSTIAETVWVLAGRDDVKWLSFYLPRAPEYSDDGERWRAAYGPRLRDWNGRGLDQLLEVRRLILNDGSTRRAAMSLYDPGRDFVESKDVPCNNWLSWLVRDGRLNLTVGVRSNDVIWGFSGVNSFEWSILQEAMAYWVGAEVGDASYLATSFHLYEHHEDRARRMVGGFGGVTPYDFGLTAPEFSTAFEDFDGVLGTWFDIEAEIRSDPEPRPCAVERLGDPLFGVALELVRIHCGVRKGWSPERTAEELGSLPPYDLVAAAYELYGRKEPSVLDGALDPRVAGFLAAYSKEVDPSAPTGTTLIDGIKRLHAEKDAAYGPSWKKRGELVSILPNVARKVDRLEQYVAGAAELVDETVLDTAVDLFVYLLKYRLYLLEQAPELVADDLAGVDPQLKLSDVRAAFDFSADMFGSADGSWCTSDSIATDLVGWFERFYEPVTRGETPVAERIESVSRAAALSFELVRSLAGGHPSSVRSLLVSGANGQGDPMGGR